MSPALSLSLRLGSPLDTAESVILDGNNGVTQQPRQHFPDAPYSAGAALIAVLLAVLFIRRKVPRAVLVAGLVLACLPGALHVLWLRADAPPHRGAMAATVSATVEQLQAAAPWPAQPVRVAYEEDDVLFPLGRYVVPVRAATGEAVRTVELRGSSVQATCAESAGRVVCGPAR